jgi:hypothetical protein
VTHIAYLPLFWNVKAIKMILFWRAISAVLVCAQISVTEGGACTRTKRLILTTMAMAVMVHQKQHYVPYYLDIVSNHLEIYDFGIISTFSTLRRYFFI